MRLFQAFALAITVLSAQAHADTRVELNNVKTVNLSQETDAKKEFWIVYPGQLSGICGVELRVEAGLGDIRALLSQLKVEAPFPQRETPANRIQVKDARTLAVNFFPAQEAYLAIVKISTLDGSSLAETIKRTLATEQGYTPDVVVVGRSCN